MTAPGDSDARRILRELRSGAHLELDADSRWVVARASHRAKMIVAAPLVAAMRAKGWLNAEPGEPSRLFLSAAGEGWRARGEASGDAFAAQHQARRTRIILDTEGRERAVTVNALESPLVWMHQRKLIGDAQCQAGERLRRDYTLAQLSPRLGVDWSAPIVLGSRAVKSGIDLPDIVLAAKQRFSKAMSAAGPGLSDVLFDVCCDLRGLEQSERARGWPRASAKVVLKIALDRLAAHYGMIVPPRRARLRSWTKEDNEGDDKSPSLSDSPK